MDQRLTTGVQAEINLLRRLNISTAIVGCLIAVFILFSNLVAVNAPVANSPYQAKYTASGNLQNREKQLGWDIHTKGERLKFTDQLKLNSDPDFAGTHLTQ